MHGNFLEGAELKVAIAHGLANANKINEAGEEKESSVSFC